MADKFFWYELMTTDQDAAVAFYSEVVGWNSAEMPGGMRYILLSAGERSVGGVLQLTAEMEAGGAKPGWIGYIHVADVDARLAEIGEAGGRTLMPAQEIEGVGRFAMAADPGGAPFYVMAPKPPEGQGPLADLPSTTPGAFSWHELYAGNGQEAAFAFYSGLFGWETMHEMDMGPMGVYRVFGADGVQLGGMMDKPAGIPASSWGFYATVDGIDAAIARLTAGGGTVLMGPHEVPGGSWIVQAQDPQGAAFALTSATK
jgi:predicted enzyme related to lactoylglutathione lyase